MGRYNPNYPTVLGNEFAPVATSPINIDTGSAFGYTFRTEAEEGLKTARVLMTQPPPGQPLRKVISWEMYPADVAPSTGPLRKLTVAVASGANVTGTTLVNAATFQEAMNNPTDGKGVLMTGPSAACRLWFDVSSSNTRLTAALLNNRIIDLTLRYTMSGRFDEYAVPMVMSLERPSAAVVFTMDDTITGPTGLGLNVVPRRSRLGDLNPFWNTTINPNSDPRRAPWKHANGLNNHTGLAAMAASGGTNIALRFQSSADVPAALGAFTLHYAALEVTYAAEGRSAAGGYDLTGGVGLGDDMFYADVPIFGTSSYGSPYQVPGGYDYLMVVGQGYVGVQSVTYPVPVTVDRVVPARDTFRGHRGVLLRKTIRENEEWTREDIEPVPAVDLFTSDTVYDATTIYTPSQTYPAALVGPVDQTTFGGEATALIVDDVAGREYTHLRFYARRYPGTRDYLRMYVADQVTDDFVGPYGLVTVEEFDALPEIANGWKEVTVALSAPYVSTGAGLVQLNFDSASDTSFPWEVLGADANPYRETAGSYAAATYGGVTAYATASATADLNADFSVMLVQSMPTPGNLAVSPAVQALTMLDEYCGVPVDTVPTGIRYHELTWEPVNDLAVAGFGYYEVQRRDTTMAADVWETIAEITSVTAAAMDDYEARVGVESSYRVRMVHEDGYTSPFSDTVTATITAPGVTGTNVDRSILILTSNHNPSGNLAYAMVWDNSGVPQQEFTYPEASRTTLQEFYGRDYRVAFRPLERSGTEFTRTLMLNAAGVPSETLDRGALALRDLAWDTVPYVCVRDELANRWLASLGVPSSATRDIPTKGHLVVAPVTITEVTATPAPVDVEGACEGIRLEGADQYQYWRADAPAALYGTRVMTDTFTRTAVVNGWGTSDTGQVWTATGGVAADFNTTGTTGTLRSSTVTVDRRVVLAPTYDFHRTAAQFTVPAVATAGVYHAGILTRYQDASNYYYVKVEFTTAGQFRLDVVRVVAGVSTTVHTGAVVSTYTVGTQINLEVMTRGTSILARVWKTGGTAPGWASFGNDTAFVQAQTSLAMTGLVGVQQTRATANTNANLTLTWDNITIDSIPEQYDFRAQVRPFSDQFDVSYGVDEFTNDTDSEGGWAFQISYGSVAFLVYGNDATQIYSYDLLDLGLVKNRLTWVRMVVTPDDGSGNMTAQFYTLDDDGVTWNLVDTVVASAPVQPIPPLAPGSYIQVENYDPGGIWTLQYQLRIDGVLVADPDFAAEPVGTEDFTDSQGNDWVGPEGRGICATL